MFSVFPFNTWPSPLKLMIDWILIHWRDTKILNGLPGSPPTTSSSVFSHFLMECESVCDRPGPGQPNYVRMMTREERNLPWRLHSVKRPAGITPVVVLGVWPFPMTGGDKWRQRTWWDMSHRPLWQTFSSLPPLTAGKERLMDWLSLCWQVLINTFLMNSSRWRNGGVFPYLIINNHG